MALGLEAGYKRNRWGLNVGAGILTTAAGVKWYGIAGISYNIFTKKW
jgi:hypothetical protein